MMRCSTAQNIALRSPVAASTASATPKAPPSVPPSHSSGAATARFSALTRIAARSCPHMFSAISAGPLTALRMLASTSTRRIGRLTEWSPPTLSGTTPAAPTRS